MSEITFLVQQTSEGSYIARAVGESIFSEADTIADLHKQVRDAIRAHFDEGQEPPMIRLQFVTGEPIAN